MVLSRFVFRLTGRSHRPWLHMPEFPDASLICAVLETCPPTVLNEDQLQTLIDVDKTPDTEHPQLQVLFA